jgi:hypothetical protein
MVSVPALLPDAFGVKVVFNTQPVEAGRELPHVEFGSELNSASEYVRLAKLMSDEPVFANVSAALELPVAPTLTVPKFKLVDESSKRQ